MSPLTFFLMILLSLVVGLLILYLIIYAYLRNIDKPAALPLFTIGIVAYMVAALLLGRYLPELL